MWQRRPTDCAPKLPERAAASVSQVEEGSATRACGAKLTQALLNWELGADMKSYPRAPARHSPVSGGCHSSTRI